MMASPAPSSHDALSMQPPAHPVPHLQGPFEESMLESANDLADQETDLDAAERRATLLEKPHYERVCAGRWKQKPGEKYHPLWKIAAQISFGMHLLAEGMAKSEEEVMVILQSHVDDVDGFLERTTEDLDLALSDIQERLRYLKLPLEHADVFDRMLEDRAFRASIVDGNEKIEHIVDRTAMALKDAMKDVQKGLDSTRALGRYLDDLETLWVRKTPEHEAVFVAMLGNVEGWSRAFMDLHLQGNRLNVILVELSETVSLMMRRVGDVSRKSVRHTPKGIHNQVRQPSSRTKEKGPRKSKSKQARLAEEYRSSVLSQHKALPTAPDPRQAARLSQRKRQSREGKDSGSTHASAKALPPSRSSPLSSNGLIPASMPNDADFYARPFSPESRTGSGSPRNPPDTSSLRPAKSTSRRSQLIELPAEVPHSVLLQAPLSKENRRSMNLEPSPTEQGSKRVSKKLSNKMLASLLKSPLSTRLSHIPQSVTSGLTNASYTTAAESPAGHAAEYFSADDARNATLPEESDLPDQSSPEADEKGGLRIQTNDLTSPGGNNKVVSPPRHNPAFTSHPPDLDTIQSSEAKKTELKFAHSRGHSLVPSSLGEPGPEIDEFEPFDLATLKKPASDVAGPPTIAIEPPAEAKSSSESEVQFDNPQEEEIPVTIPVKITEAPSVETPLVKEVIVSPSKPTPTPTPHPIVTELEGSAPVVAELVGTTPDIEPTGPQVSEMEGDAPRAHCFSLPPRSTGTTVVSSAGVPQAKPDEGTMTSATIASQSDFFKMPPPVVSPDETEGESGRSPTPSSAAMSPTLTMARASMMQNGKEVTTTRSSTPPFGNVISRTIARKPATRMKQLQGADLFDSISNTPPGSPIHMRTASELSSHSALRWSSGSARSQGEVAKTRMEGARLSLSTLQSSEDSAAPAPPGPGGRVMVSPDYAAQGVFEGERVDPRKEGVRDGAKERAKMRRTDIISVGGWKRLFTNGKPLKDGKKRKMPPAGGWRAEGRALFEGATERRKKSVPEVPKEKKNPNQGEGEKNGEQPPMPGSGNGNGNQTGKENGAAVTTTMTMAAATPMTVVETVKIVPVEDKPEETQQQDSEKHTKPPPQEQESEKDPQPAPQPEGNGDAKESRASKQVESPVQDHDEDAADPGPMMTSAGKDVLWFKGMTREGVWVSTTSGG